MAEQEKCEKLIGKGTEDFPIVFFSCSYVECHERAQKNRISNICISRASLKHNHYIIAVTTHSSRLLSWLSWPTAIKILKLLLGNLIDIYFVWL